MRLSDQGENWESVKLIHLRKPGVIVGDSDEPQGHGCRAVRVGTGADEGEATAAQDGGCHKQ